VIFPLDMCCAEAITEAETGGTGAVGVGAGVGGTGAGAGVGADAGAGVGLSVPANMSSGSRGVIWSNIDEWERGFPAGNYCITPSEPSGS